MQPAFIYNFPENHAIRPNLVELSSTFDKSPWKVRIDLMAGDYSDKNLAGEPALWKHVYEASICYQPTIAWKFQAGILPSHIGFETAIAKNNWNLSRSLLAENSPYYETGIWIEHQTKSNWVMAVLLVNGWQHIKDNNRSPAFGTQIQSPVGKKSRFNSSVYIGNEGSRNGRQLRLFQDFYIETKLNKKDRLALIFDIGAQQRPGENHFDNWYGAALLYQHGFNEKWKMVLRAEYYLDRKNIIISTISLPAKGISGLAFNLDHQKYSWLLVRLEFRTLRSGSFFCMKGNIPQKEISSLLACTTIYF